MRLHLAVVVALLVLAGCREPNLPPSIDMEVAGPGAAIANVPCSLSVAAFDPDSDRVALRFNWDDGDTSDWSEFVSSGDTAKMGHAWTKGRYELRAQARDERGKESEWSAPYNLTVRSPYPDSVVAEIDAEFAGDGSKLVLSPDGAFLYIAGDISIQVVRTSDNTVCGEVLVPAPYSPYFVAVSPDGQRLYFTSFDDSCVRVARTSDYTVVDSIPLGPVLPRDLVFHPSGDRLFVTGWDGYGSRLVAIRISDNTVTAQTTIDEDCYDLLMLPGGEFLYAGGWDELLVVRTADLSIVKSIPAGGTGMTLSEDGQYVHSAGDAISTIKVENHAFVDMLPVSASDVAALPGGEYLYCLASSCDIPFYVVSVSERMPVDSVAETTGYLDDVLSQPDGSRVYCGWYECVEVYGYSSRMKPPGGP